MTGLGLLDKEAGERTLATAGFPGHEVNLALSRYHLRQGGGQAGRFLIAGDDRYEGQGGDWR